MHDEERTLVVVDELVRGMKPVQEIADDRDDDARRDRRARALGELDQPSDRDALDVLHDDEELAALVRDVERLHHVRVLDPRGEDRLVEEHRREGFVLRELLVHALDRDELRVPPRAAAPDEHRRHPARRELAEELIVLRGDHLRHGRQLTTRSDLIAIPERPLFSVDAVMPMYPVFVNVAGLGLSAMVATWPVTVAVPSSVS